jgi:hypothetical protein
MHISLPTLAQLSERGRIPSFSGSRCRTWTTDFMSLSHDFPSSSVHTHVIPLVVLAVFSIRHTNLFTALAAAFWFGTLAIYDSGTTSSESASRSGRERFCMEA